MHLPLNKTSQEIFNETAAWEFFNEKAGDPYGYYNFLFGWIDTPFDNYPPLLPSFLLPIAFSVVEKIDYDTIDIFFNQAMNHRLGTTGLNISEITGAAADKNLTIDDVVAMVEKDGWLYYGAQPRNTTSYVCSAFVAGVYKAAGLFGDLEI